MKKPVALILALAAVAAVPGAASAAAAPPKLVGAPILTYAIASNATNGRFVSVGAKVRLDRPFASRAEQRRYSVVAAPRLTAGQDLADELFGGTSLGRLSGREAVWYAAEAVQLKRRRSVSSGARWQVALARGGKIVGAVKTVTLRRA
jgi:hypothetical protein